jgi:hypothetical protein
VKAFFDVLHQATHAAGRRGHYPAFISQQIQKRTGGHGLPMYGGEIWASQRDSAVYWLCVITLNNQALCERVSSRFVTGGEKLHRDIYHE